MLKFRTPENVFKSTPMSAKSFAMSPEITTNGGGYDETDRAVVVVGQNGDVSKSNGSDVDSGRESLSSTNAFLMEDDTMHDPPKVKVVGELLKKDVKTGSDPATVSVESPSATALNGGIDLSSLIIAKEIIIGSSPFTPKTDPKLCPKKKPTPNDAVRKKRLNEHIDNKQKLTGVLIKRNIPVEKSPPSIPKDATVINKTVAKKSPITRSHSKDSMSSSPTPATTLAGDKFAAKKKLMPKFSLDSKTKEFKKPDPVRNPITKTDSDRKKSSKPVPPMSSLKTKSNLNGKSTTRARNDASLESITTYSYELYNESMQKRSNADFTENSFYKDLSSVFPGTLDSSPIKSNGCTSCLPIFRRQSDVPGKSDEQLKNEKTWLDCERLWLMHKSGFTAVRLLSRSHDSGKVGICLEATGEQATVDEDDVELANPAQFDQCEDLAQLRYLNESSALHTLRQRYGSNLIHTYAGPTMIIINPMVPLNIYSDKVAQMFRGCKPEDMPAHVFSLAQSAYRDMLTSRRDHSIVFIGRSGSGKTTNYKHVLQYLVLTASSSNKILNLEKLNAIWTILEAFGNARTSLNNNATRFTHLFSLDFDHAGQIVSSSIQIFSCEKWRLVRRSDGEHAFHILYKLLAGVDGILRKELALDQISASEQNIFFTPLQKNEEKQRALMDFSRICAAFKTAGISETEQKTVFMILAAIVHLGYAGTSKVGTNSRWQFNNPAAAQRAAKCLGTTVEELSRAIFTQGVSTPTSVIRNTYRNTSPTDSTKSLGSGDEFTGLDALEGFVVGLYVEVFNLVGSYINRNISANVHTVSSIIVLDCPGFQNPASCGQLQDGASFNDLCHNYFQERLQSLFHYMNLDLPRERYNQEHIEVTLDKYEEGSPEPIVSLLDNSSASFVRNSQCDLRQSPSTDKRAPGLLWLLDDNSSLQPASEHYFVDKVFSLYGDREDQVLIRKAPGNNHFMIQHCQGTNPVLYRADGWLKQCKENPFIKVAITILQDSNNKEIANAFASCRGVGLTSSVATLDCSTHSLRRVSSIRRTFNAGFKRKSVSLQVKFNIDGIIETLRRTRVKFAHCFLPHHDAGLMDKSSSNSLVSSSLTTHDTAINVPLMRSQLRGSEILPVVRLNKQGYPKSMSLAEFKRRFMLLSSNDSAALAATSDDQTVAKNILLDADVDESSYRIGLSEVFFRSGVLTQLEALRDDKLADRVIKFQAYCRGYLSRKRLAKLKIEDVAIRCIQRNVRKFMLVRDWPWWRLLVRITPLLNVHRTEQELKTKTEELEAFRIQCEKLEQERNTLKQENAKLDAKLSELSVDLAEEHSAAHLASERLDLETAERMRLENEVQHLQAEKKKLQESSEKLETELLCMKTAEVNGIIGIDDDDSLSIGDDNSSGSGGVYKQRYERALRELEYTKRRLQQQHHDDLEQLIALRKQLEKKIADAYEEVEEQRQVVAQWKRKVQKLNGEMSDLRLMLEDSNSRNNLLEKKQRKFDSELLLLQEELRQEKQNRERVVREKDIVSAEKYTLEQNLSALKVDLELKEQKLLNLNRELQEISYGGNTEEEISRLRKVKHELENRIAEQDEELDDLAGQVELLNQAKLRLQMDLEQVRKEHKKEINQRDDESEKIRLNTTKKVKALECQLENEHEERTMLLRERHELERKLAEIEDRERCNRSADLETLNRLRRDLKKTKILLHDAQLMLQQAKLDAPSKAILRQLRNQLEDAECARNAAVKARQLAEADLADITSMLEDVQKAKSDAEEKATLYSREKSQLQSQLDENEEELAEVLKKYRNTVQQLSNEQLILHEQANRIAELESERSSLKDQLAEVTSRLENIETHGDPTSSLTVKRLELKTKELESKLDLEQTTRSRMEVQIGRLKEAAERLQHDADIARSKEASAQENVRKLQRALRDAREVQSNYESKEATESARKRELEKKVEQLETELSSAKADLKLALQRVDDLQCAIQGDLDDNDDDQTDSDNDDSGSSNASLQSFLLQSNGETSIHKWLNNGAGSENSKI
ncbi:unconventional myosin-XVIIIa isoform X3 [Planococcus citri]|uniref:unconventional myosin-XVIIIa isoform X3 n=1 Tax=Planococcus citri TaxID=170843 RepID=UPI0031F74355